MSSSEKSAWVIRKIQKQGSDLQDLHVAACAIESHFKENQQQLVRLSRQVNSKRSKVDPDRASEINDWIHNSRKTMEVVLKQVLIQVQEALETITHATADQPVDELL
jgi:hypothetical protein